MRESYLPVEVRGKEPETPEGTNLEVYRYEYEKARTGRTVYGLVVFKGRGNRPIANYYYRNEGARDRSADEYIDDNRASLLRKQEDRDRRRNEVHGLEIGKILYSSWGYDQTNLSWYEVVGIIGKMVSIREIEGRVIRGHGSSQEYVVPVPGQFIGTPMRKRPSGTGNSVSIRLNSYSSAHLWDGKPKSQTGAGWGH